MSPIITTKSGFAASTSPNKLKSIVGSEQDVSATRVTLLFRKRGLLGARGKAGKAGMVVGAEAQPAIGAIAKAVVAAEARNARRCNMGSALP